MSSWAQSLIKLSTFEVEELQKRLAEVVGRREAAEMRLVMMAAEAEAETERARGDADAGWYLIGFREGLKARRAAVHAEIVVIQAEEAGCRDALTSAFESQKKYEHVAAQMAETARREQAHRETQAMNDIGLRRAAAGKR
jgi:flagellar FliJ protein